MCILDVFPLVGKKDISPKSKDVVPETIMFEPVQLLVPTM